MKLPGKPNKHFLRIASLYGVNVLDVPQDKKFSRIARIATHFFDVPLALVSLVDDEHQWLKPFCHHAIRSDDVFYVPDTFDDYRFASHPLVKGSPYIRFYAGIALQSFDGERVGILSIIDFWPREFCPDELIVLNDLASCVETELAYERVS